MEHRLVEIGMRDAAGMTGLLRPIPRLRHRTERTGRLSDEPQGQGPMRKPADPGVVSAEQRRIRLSLAVLIKRKPRAHGRDAAVMTAEIEVDCPDAMPGLQLYLGILHIPEVAQHDLRALAVHDGIRKPPAPVDREPSGALADGSPPGNL